MFVSTFRGQVERRYSQSEGLGVRVGAYKVLTLLLKENLTPKNILL